MAGLTYYWSAETAEDLGNGMRFTQIAGDWFQRLAHPVSRGDRLYVFTTDDARPVLLHRFTVSAILNRDEALAEADGELIWEAETYLNGTSTPMDTGRILPTDIARRLTFEGATKTLSLAQGNRLTNHMALAAPKWLTRDSEALLDSLIDADE